VVVAAALCFVWLLLSTLRPHARPVCRAFVVTAHRRSVRKHVSLFLCCAMITSFFLSVPVFQRFIGDGGRR
jgi:dolichyl-phosphate-mannose--protein O-mannosyl transferase